MKQMLKISEYFPSLQGEGRTAGMPALFIRLAGCNLLCKGKTWTCDSLKQWQTPTLMFTPKTFAHRLAVIIHPKYFQRVIITGGEPMLQQRAVFWLLFHLILTGTKHIEIETNGTILPKWYMRLLPIQWNCSPKLESSGAAYPTRYNRKALQTYKRLKADFKFVIGAEKDVDEAIFYYIAHLRIQSSHVWLMPAACTRDDMLEKSPTVWHYAFDNGYNFGTRTHIFLFDQQTKI